MLTVYLCDDNHEILDQYNRLIEKITKQNRIEVTISLFSSGEELLFHLSSSHDRVDIIYLDVLMGELNGVETANRIRTLGCQAEIIFLTVSKEYVLDVYDSYPFHYLLKKKNGALKFEEVFLKAVSVIRERESDLFLCESGSDQSLIPIKNISFFEIRRRVITMHYNEVETLDFYSKMEELEKQVLHKNFVRVHRSYLVNLLYISKFKQNSIYLKTGVSIPVGTTYMKQVKYSFTDFIERSSIHMV